MMRVCARARVSEQNREKERESIIGRTTEAPPSRAKTGELSLAGRCAGRGGAIPDADREVGGFPPLPGGGV